MRFDVFRAGVAHDGARLVEVLGEHAGVDTPRNVNRALHVGDTDDLHAPITHELDQWCTDLAVSLDDDPLLVREPSETLEDRRRADCHPE